MQPEKENLGEVYAARAAAELEPPASSISIPKIREARDLVYNGTNSKPTIEATTTDGIPLAINKKSHRRKVSPFTIIVILFSLAVASVLYIGNILAVGRLMSQNNQLQIKHRQNLNNQELLKVQINRLSNLDRIQQVAHDQLGMQNSKELPVWLEIDPERPIQIEETLQQQMERKQ